MRTKKSTTVSLPFVNCCKVVCGDSFCYKGFGFFGFVAKAVQKVMFLAACKVRLGSSFVGYQLL